jgi:prepilin-type N-terminal cleavage/methylation domain-containing protein
MCLTPRHIARSAFTLVELLIVIAIIAVLTALTTAAVVRFRHRGPAMATTTNLSKIKGALETQWKAVVSKATNDILPSNFLSYAQWVDPNITSLVDPRARQRYVDLKLAQAFPTSFAEALDPTNGYASPPVWAQPFAPYKAFLKNIGITTGTTDPGQQAVCLMMALSIGPQNNQVTQEVLGGTAANLWTLNNGKQTYACMDAWGQPMLFSRYTRQNPTNSPVNSLQLQPVVLSVGPDGKGGVDNTLTLLSPTNRDAEDNLYTRQEWDQYLKKQ